MNENALIDVNPEMKLKAGVENVKRTKWKLV